MTKQLIVTIVLALSLFLSSTKAVNASNLDISVIDINALWTKNTVRITFNSNGGGAAPADQVYAYGIERSLPGQSSMSKEGYSFIGWSTSSTATTPEWHAGDCSHTAFGYANADSKTSKTLYAVWKANDAVTVADFLGYGKSSSTPSASEYDTASLVEKVNYLEDKLTSIESNMPAGYYWKKTDSGRNSATSTKTEQTFTLRSDALCGKVIITSIRGFIIDPEYTSLIRYSHIGCLHSLIVGWSDVLYRYADTPWDFVASYGFKYVTLCDIPYNQQGSAGASTDYTRYTNTRVLRMEIPYDGGKVQYSFGHNVGACDIAYEHWQLVPIGS